jgi:hypothetical protein
VRLDTAGRAAAWPLGRWFVPAELDAVIEGGPLDAPLADAKLHKIARGDFAPEFPLEWALKDMDLAIAAADGTPLPMLEALSRQWRAAVEAGYGRNDVSAAVGYTSAVSERDYYLAEQAREAAEIDATPEAERQEIRDIYAAKGFAGDLLDRVVDTITANRDRWLATMMDEELHLQRVQAPDIIRSALTWWSFTFPVGTCVTGTIALAVRSGDQALRWASVILYLLLLAAWLTVSVRTARGTATGRLFRPLPAKE